MSAPRPSSWSLQRLAATAGVAVLLAGLSLILPPTAHAHAGSAGLAASAAISASR